MFQGIDSRIKFCLLTLTGKERPSAEAEFAFFLYRTEQLQDAERKFTLAPDDFALFNPNTRTCPVFRTRKDAEISGKMYRRSGVFWKEAGEGEPEVNPWGIRLHSMFHMSNNSNLFRTREQLEEEKWKLEGNVFKKEKEQYLPLYEAKLFHQFDHRFATFRDADEQALKGGNAQDVSAEEKKNPGTVAIPRYWVPEEEVIKRLTLSGAQNKSSPPQRSNVGQTRRVSSQLALRKITNSTNERTGIFTMIAGVGISDSGTTITVGSTPLET